MAGQNRSPSDLVALTTRLAREPAAFGFFSTARRLECLHRDKPRFGNAPRPADEPVRFAQEPSLAFAPSELAAYEPAKDDTPPRLVSRFFGLFGPNGPLPQHITEYARDRLRNAHDPTFSRFVDVFHHRMYMLFYRAWANAEPTVSFDRPDSDRFATYLGALFGLTGLALRDRDAFPDRAKLHYVGRLASLPRHPDGLQAMLEDYFELPAEIIEFVGSWQALPADDWWRLGDSASGNKLGDTTLLGGNVWGCQQKFRIQLGPMDQQRYPNFLPGGAELAALVAIVRNYVGFELDWDLRLLLRGSEVPRFGLGGQARLGWSTWLNDRTSGQDADDLILDESVIEPAAATPHIGLEN